MYHYIKRFIDITGSVLLLLLLSPLFIIISLIIKADSGPAFYTQTRIGRNCQHFPLYKFRSMVINADKIGSYATTKNDSRITPVGRFIRKTSIDELPQLLNVLKGDMSLIGPRPDVPVQQNLYSPEQWQQRHTVRPGITGLAQATIRSSGTMNERIALDLDYIKKCGFILDCIIIWKTVMSVIATRGTN